jgi:hypothetical protein
VRFLLANNHCITDPTAGVTHSLRTIMRWLADAGCHILTTARFESRVTFTIEEHLQTHGVDLSGIEPGATVRYSADGVPVTLLLTRRNDETRPNRAEGAQYQRMFDALLNDFAPDQVIACNAHPMIQEIMARARKRGITTAFAVPGFGYYEPRYFRHVDHAFTCSQFLPTSIARRSAWSARRSSRRSTGRRWSRRPNRARSSRSCIPRRTRA